MNRASILTPLLIFTVTLSAAPMVRVVGVHDARTIVVDRNGVAVPLQLSGVIVPPSEEKQAIDYLRAKVVDAWVMIETDAAGGVHLFRSPDAFNINAAMAQRAYLKSGAPMTYLGQIYPEDSPRAKAKSGATSTRQAPAPKASKPKLTPPRRRPTSASKRP